MRTSQAITRSISSNNRDIRDKLTPTLVTKQGTHVKTTPKYRNNVDDSSIVKTTKAATRGAAGKNSSLRQNNNDLKDRTPSQLRGHFEQIRKELDDLKYEMQSKHRNKSPSDHNSSVYRGNSRSRSRSPTPKDSLYHNFVKTKQKQGSNRPVSPYLKASLLKSSVSTKMKEKDSRVTDEGTPFYYDDSPKVSKSGSGRRRRRSVSNQDENIHHRSHLESKHALLNSVYTEQASVDQNDFGTKHKTGTSIAKKVPPKALERIPSNLHHVPDHTPTFLQSSLAQRLEVSSSSHKNLSPGNKTPMTFSPLVSGDKATSSLHVSTDTKDNAYFVTTIKNLNTIIESMKLKDEMSKDRLAHLQHLYEQSQHKVHTLESRVRDLEDTLALKSASFVESETKHPTEATGQINKLTQLADKLNYKIVLLTEEKRMLEDLVRALLLEKEWGKISHMTTVQREDTSSNTILHPTSHREGPPGEYTNNTSLSVASVLDRLKKNSDNNHLPLGPLVTAGNLTSQESENVIKKLNFEELRNEARLYMKDANEVKSHLLLDSPEMNIFLILEECCVPVSQLFRFTQ